MGLVIIGFCNTSIKWFEMISVGVFFMPI